MGGDLGPLAGVEVEDRADVVVVLDVGAPAAPADARKAGVVREEDDPAPDLADRGDPVLRPEQVRPAPLVVGEEGAELGVGHGGVLLLDPHHQGLAGVGGEKGPALVEHVAEEGLLEDRPVVDREHPVDRPAADVEEPHPGRQLVGQRQGLRLGQRPAVQ